MIEAKAFLEPARELGFDTWAGVPCSYLKPFINYIIDADGLAYVSSANEGDAVATATGAALAGRRAVAMMQNSGLGNAVSPLTSLNWVFRVPVLVIVTLRGDPEHGDEPQHELMGAITTRLLDTMGLPWAWFPRHEADIAPCLETAVAAMDTTGLPYALVMRKGSVAPHALTSPPRAPRPPGTCDEAPATAERPRRAEALEAVVAATDPEETVVLGTTGYTGRELYAIADRPNQLYVVGSMGCASSLGLGLSLAVPDRRVVVLDGDGAALMRMGNLATVGAYAGDGFRHVILDNGMHESTGGQATVSGGVRFARVAAACGYASAVAAANVEAIGPALAPGAGPRLLHLKTAPGVPEGLPRPSVRPTEVKRRLMGHLGVSAPWAGVMR